jgi:hypothetical protein
MICRVRIYPFRSRIKQSEEQSLDKVPDDPPELPIDPRQRWPAVLAEASRLFTLKTC